MSISDLAQPGVISDPTQFAEYLTFKLKDNNSLEELGEKLSSINNIRKSVGQKDATNSLTVTIGFSAKGWQQFFPEKPLPDELHDFIERQDDVRHFPSTNGDVFFMIKSSRMDLNFQVAKYLNREFSAIAELIEDTQGFRYLDNRDMIDFVDGTENPKGDERNEAILVNDGPYKGGSYLIIQKYVHKADKWDAQGTSEQEGAIGRTKFDDIEIDDDKKTPYAHNVKSKVEIDGTEFKMFRQNRPFGNAKEHGTMFVGFAASASTIETSLKQMITADEDGNYDKLLDFVDAVTGSNYFVPPVGFIKDE